MIPPDGRLLPHLRGALDAPGVAGAQVGRGRAGELARYEGLSSLDQE